MPKSKGRPARARVRRGPTPRKSQPRVDESTPEPSEPGRTTIAPPSSGRYTPPVNQQTKHSPAWYAPVLFSLMGLGALIIMLNYIGLVPGDTQNAYLYIGLGLITLGFLGATQWK